MKGILPEEIRLREDKAEFSNVFGQALLRPEIIHILRLPYLKSLGWIRGEAIDLMYQALCKASNNGQPLYLANIWYLWNFIAVESWWSHMFGNQSQEKE